MGLFKEKFEFYRAQLKTKEGLWDFFVGNFIWGFLIIKYNEIIFNFIFSALNFFPEGVIRYYFSYLIFGAFLIPISLVITFILTKLFKKIKET